MELFKLSVAELIDGYRQHLFSVADVIETYINRIEQVNETVNAVVVPLFDQARSEAKLLDEMLLRGKTKGPLHGVPVTIKENIDVSGTPSTWGIEGRKHVLAKTDDPTVQRLRDAGAIIIAKTNAMQLLMGCETVNPIYGRTNNPWCLDRTPGGSSGGEGVSVASFFSSIGVGTDIGGSVRTPAHFCGIHSLKPTSGSIPQQPPTGIYHIKREASVMSSAGPLARTAEDLQIAFNILSNQKTEFKPVTNLTIGVWNTDGVFWPSLSIQRAIGEVSDIFKKEGMEVVPYTPPYVIEAMQGFYGLMGSDDGSGIKKSMGNSKQEYPIQNLHKTLSYSRLKRKVLTILLKLAGQKTVAQMIFPYVGLKSEKDLLNLGRRREQIQKAVMEDMEKNKIDVILCPVFPVPALYHNGSKQLSYEGAYNSFINYIGFCSGAFSFTIVREGEEVLERNNKDFVLRAAMENEKNSKGLPVAVQFVAKPNQEEVVLSIMKWLEEKSKTKEDFPPNLLKKLTNG